MALLYGKLPATGDERDLLYSTYAASGVALPKIPAKFTHDNLVKVGWGMLGNDEWGDCAWAGPAHETMLLTAEAGVQTPFTTAGVLSDYSAGTGFNQNAGPPGENPTDQGSNVRSVLAYRAKTGIIDAKNKRHKIGAYIKLNQKNIQQIKEAVYVLQAVGIGFEVPSSAQDQFANHEPWSIVPGSPIEGGHYVPIVAYDETTFTVVTWGQLQIMEISFFQKYCDEAWAYVSQEDLKSGKTLEGFNLTQLQADLKLL